MEKVTIEEIQGGLRWLATKLKFANPDKFENMADVVPYYAIFRNHTKDQAKLIFAGLATKLKSFPSLKEINSTIIGEADEEIEETYNDFIIYLRKRCEHKCTVDKFFENIFLACGFDWQKVRYSPTAIEHIEKFSKKVILKIIRDIQAGRKTSFNQRLLTEHEDVGYKEEVPDYVDKWTTETGKDITSFNPGADTLKPLEINPNDPYQDRAKTFKENTKIMMKLIDAERAKGKLRYTDHPIHLGLKRRADREKRPTLGEKEFPQILANAMSMLTIKTKCTEVKND